MDDTWSADIDKYLWLPLGMPLSHPSRPSLLTALAFALLHRYEHSCQEHDLIVLIPLLAEALLLPLSPTAAQLFNTPKVFYTLTRSLFFRYELYHSLEDFEHALKYYRYILTLPPLVLGKSHTLSVVYYLTRLVAHGVKTGTVTVVQLDMAEEMVRVCQLAAATDPSSKHIGPISKSARSVLRARFDQCEQRSESIHILGLFREIEKMCPAERSPEFYVDYGAALSIVFQQTPQYAYCKQAVEQFNKALVYLPPDHILHAFSHLSIAMVLRRRFILDHDPTSLEEAIRHSRAALDTSPPGNPVRSIYLVFLSHMLKLCHAFFGNAEFLREADSYSREALSQELPEHLQVKVVNLIEEFKTFNGGFRGDDSLDALEEEIRLKREQLARISIGHSERPAALSALGFVYRTKFLRTRMIADLEEEIHHHSLALAASPPNDCVRWMSLVCLGQAFQDRFAVDNDETNIRHIEQSITCCRDALELCPRGQMFRFEPLRTLAVSLGARSYILLREADFEESMALFQSALDEEYAYPHARLEISAQWAFWARIHRHPLAARAYERAISLMLGTLTVGPTLEVQHRRA